jgi:hypothetical protein
MSLLEKQCCMCKEGLPLEQFNKDSSKKDGKSNRCKACQLIYNRQWKKANPDKVRVYRKEARARESTQARNKRLQRKRKWYYANREILLPQMKQRRIGKEGYLKTMLASAKSRAKECNLQFDINMEYLWSIATDHCPVDSLPFDWERRLETDKSLPLTTPSLDRIDSSQGYIKGNVKIIGWKWNAKKSNMNLNDLLLLVEYVRSATESKKVGHF